MRRACAPVILLLLLVVAIAACGSADDAGPGSTAMDAAPGLKAKAAVPAAPVAAGALAEIADVAATRRRLSYVNLQRVGEVSDLIAPATVLHAVLGRGAARVGALKRNDLVTAVQAGPATVVRGTHDRMVIGVGGSLRARLADPRPEVNAIAPVAQSAAQSCLGDATAQTIVGPGRLGADSALGVGLRVSRDAPAGVQLAVCYAPHLRRDLRRAERRITTWFASRAGGEGPRPAIAQTEIGEREMLSAVLPAGALGAGEISRLLAGRASLLALVGAT
jgi:hypothetical protein